VGKSDLQEILERNRAWFHSDPSGERDYAHAWIHGTFWKSGPDPWRAEARIANPDINIEGM
jgi:hypothetical protein